mmetsp:Transcript_57848/g.141878  ORF Transcript_57848/g.141878 Transcript_57848/m.141878 type:complete len:184 (-) Transcript_57848:59-610(-)
MKLLTFGVVCAAGLGAALGSARSDEALDACGLPTGYYQTSHCFNDATHHTCCLLGPEARTYADNSGNPIGSAASKAFYAKHGRMPTDSDLTPWCTCFGSLVCSYYAEKFPNDGTGIKFIYEPGSNPPEGAFDIPTNRNCEAKARDYFKVAAHGTPGVTNPTGQADLCPDYDVAEHVKPLSSVA